MNCHILGRWTSIDFSYYDETQGLFHGFRPITDIFSDIPSNITIKNISHYNYLHPIKPRCRFSRKPHQKKTKTQQKHQPRIPMKFLWLVSKNFPSHRIPWRIPCRSIQPVTSTSLRRSARALLARCVWPPAQGCCSGRHIRPRPLPRPWPWAVNMGNSVAKMGRWWHYGWVMAGWWSTKHEQFCV